MPVEILVRAVLLDDEDAHARFEHRVQLHGVELAEPRTTAS